MRGLVFPGFVMRLSKRTVIGSKVVYFGYLLLYLLCREIKPRLCLDLPIRPRREAGTNGARRKRFNRQGGRDSAGDSLTNPGSFYRDRFPGLYLPCRKRGCTFIPSSVPLCVPLIFCGRFGRYLMLTWSLLYTPRILYPFRALTGELQTYQARQHTFRKDR